MSRDVHLNRLVQSNWALAGAKYNFAELSVWVAPQGGSLESGVAVDRQGWESWQQVKPRRLGNLLARADRQRQRVWFIDTDAQRVVVAWDMASGVVSGPDDSPPDWATLERGVALPSIVDRRRTVSQGP